MKTAIIGGGKGAKAILEMIVRERLKILSPEIIAVVDPNDDAPGIVYAREHGIPTMKQIAAALSLPGLEFILELTGRDDVLKELYRLIPPGIRVMDHVVAQVFWDLETTIYQAGRELEAKTALERRFLQFIANAHDMITIKDLAGRYLVINPQAAALFGKKPEDFVGATDAELFPPRLARLLTAKDKELIQSNAYSNVEETLNIGGETRYLNTVRFPILDHKGEVAGVCSISRDVTEQKALQRAFIQSEKLAAVGKLAAGVAHELNNPLTGILTFAEELKHDAEPGSPVIADYEVIIREAMRCRQIVRDLLDYARLEKPQRQDLDLNRVIERSLTLVAKQAAFHDILIHRELAPDLPPVSIDPNQMQQVFLNLVINAAEAMNNAGTIAIASRPDPDGHSIEAVVRDHGCGIPQEKLQQIFEPFYSTKGQQGNGLGLNVVQSIVEQHGGTVKVESEVGKGSAFTVRLPIAAKETGRINHGLSAHSGH